MHTELHGSIVKNVLTVIEKHLIYQEGKVWITIKSRMQVIVFSPLNLLGNQPWLSLYQAQEQEKSGGYHSQALLM